MAEHALITPSVRPVSTRGGAHRRNLVTGFTAALLAGSGVAAAIPMPDAGLIRLARAVEYEAALFTRTASAQDFGWNTPEHQAADHALDRISERQAELVDAVVDTPVTTLAGLQALAAALVAVDDQVLNEANRHDNERLTRHLVKGLLALRGAE